MSVRSVACKNIVNRSPWKVVVRSSPQQDRQFPYNNKGVAEAYLADLITEGVRAKLIQLETSFQLRLRRKGVKVQILTFSTYAEAEQACLKIESDLSVSIIKDYSVATQITLRDLMIRYRDEVTKDHKGGDVERNRINRICRDEAFVDKKLAALTTEDLQDFICDRLTQVAPSSVDRDLDVISQTLNYAKDVWKISPVESPFAGLRRPKYFNERDRRLSGDEELRLLAAARADENPYVEPAIILALETAARRGELLSLKVADINLDERYALLRETKNGRSRKVPLTTRAMQVCMALMIDCDSDDALLKLSANALKIGFFRRIVPASGVQDFHFHDLRHESISRLAETGMFQLIELQAISGHRDTRMLMRYAHLCSGNLAKKMDNAAVERTTNQYFHRGRMRKSESVHELPIAVPKPSATAPMPSNVISFANVRNSSKQKAGANRC